MTQSLTPEDLAGLLERANGSCPPEVEHGTESFTYWMNGINRARIEIVAHVPDLLARIRALEERILAIEEALEPIATVCAERVYDSDDDTAGVAVKVKHLRAARAALTNKENDRG